MVIILSFVLMKNEDDLSELIDFYGSYNSDENKR
jgi:hypothetical protein